MLPQILNDVRGHPASSVLFLALWIAVWAVTVVTWQTDAAGYSVGMSPVAIPLHFLLPLLVGALVARWRSGAAGPSDKACAFAGLVFGFVHFAVLLLVDALWIPAVESGLDPLDLAAETAGFAVGYAAISVVLSIAGGRTRTMFATA